MEVVEITITIKVDENNFDERELRYNVLEGFPERTGYEIQQLEIDMSN